MKFKDLDIGRIFTWWDREHILTGVKATNFQAFCFNSLLLVGIHANKDVKEPEPIPEDVILKFGHTGQAFLCSTLPAGKMFARRVLLIGGEIMHEEDLKAAQTPRTGEEQIDLNEVYITLEIFERRYKALETAFKMLKTMIEEKYESPTSDNRIMSTSRIKNLALATE